MPKKIILFAIILFLSLLFMNSVRAETQVQGELSGSRTWTASNSPYTIVNTVEIPSNATLTIEPGATVNCPNNFNMFKLIGNIVAQGTPENHIIFNGGGNSLFFNVLDSKSTTFADLEYAEFRDGAAFWNYGPGYFSLKNSHLENLNDSSYLWYPSGDVYIEYNKFINAAGFAIDHSGDNNVYIRHNLFNGLNPDLTKFDDFYAQSKASWDNSNIVIEYNSFINIDGIALELESGAAKAKMSAKNNYWGTIDAEIIGAMIYDKNDNSALAGVIEYDPFLAEPDPNTPDIERPDALEIDEVSTPTTAAEQTVSGIKPAETAVWLNGEEIILLNSDTIWSYNLELTSGENQFNFQTVDAGGVKSKITSVLIEYTAEEDMICAEWTYSDWGECVNGEQARSVASALPEGCNSGDPVLSQTCTAEAEIPIDSFVEAEKALVKSVDENLTSRLFGRILLQVEENGEGWYVYPEDKQKYYLGRPADAFDIMRNLGLGATHEFITGHELFPNRVLGKILLDVEENGEAYYINPTDKKAYYLGRPADAFSITRKLGLGITNENIRKIGVGEL
ncbi:MAG: right-handed parallel beta-helix repeat-containing protein [Patescibacteria group bacterium]|nr:right-handed parallel beta-helix repeat-containing protein [Patescibacteria group bacterium]